MPDLVYFTKPQASRLGETHAQFAPTFVLESLSPRTAHNDTGPKFAAYELHGVQEYWILDPQNLEHRFFKREGDMLAEFAVAAERIESSSIRGFWVKRSWLNPGKLPAVRNSLAEILGGKRRRRG